MTVIPKVLHSYIHSAHDPEENVLLIGTSQPDGFAQITPRGSADVYDDEHFSLWERGRGTTNALFTDGMKAMVYLRNTKLRSEGILPIGGIARFYGTVSVHKSGPVYEEVWKRLKPSEREWDKDKKGWAVLIKVERAEDLFGGVLKLS